MRKRILFAACLVLILAFAFMTLPAAYAASLPEGIELSDSEITIDLAKSERVYLDASVYPSDASQEVDYRSSNTAILKMSQSGRIYPYKRGTAVVTVRSDSAPEVFSTCTITVIDSDIPEYITLSKSEIIIDLAEDDDTRLYASAFPENAEQDVDWSSSDRDVVRVSSSGTVTGRKVGTAVVTAKSEEDSSVSAQCIVHVIDSDIPEYITLNKSEITLDLAHSEKGYLSAEAFPEIANQKVNWKTNSSSIVRVSSSGVLTPRKVGTTVVKAVSRESSAIYAECVVTVIDTRIPEYITLNQSEITLDLAHSEKGYLSAEAFPEIANQKVNWKTNSSSIVSVSSSGVLTPRRVGTTIVKAVSRQSSSVYTECVVNVIDTRIPTSISLPGVGQSIEMERYQTLQLTPLVEPSFADQDVEWKTSRSSVVSVSSRGVLTAKKAGTATITCYSERSSAIKAVVQVTVKQYPTPDSITISPETNIMVLGDILQLTPVSSPADEKLCEYYTWKTSSSSRASVSSGGLVTAKRTGYVTITCTSMQNSRVRDTLKFLIVSKDSPHYIKLYNGDQLLNNQTITLNPTDRIQLSSEVLPADKNPAIRYKSSSTSRATVDANGVLTAKSAGTVTITAVSQENSEIVASFKVNIVNLPAPDSIELSVPAQTIEIYETLQITPITYPIGEKRSQEFYYSTSSSSIARVSESGLVTPRKTGTVTITVKSKRNSRVKASVTVKIIDSNMPDRVAITEKSTITIEKGQKFPMHVTVTPATAIQTVKWTSSRTSRATVDQNGVVTGVGSGSVTIYATSTYNSDRRDYVYFKVVSKAAPTAVKLDAPSNLILKGEQAQLTVVPTPSNASVLGSYTSSNTSVATVDENGVVTAHATGTALISFASMKNGAVRTTMPIVVYDANTPGSITLSSNMVYMVSGNTHSLSASIFPSTASQDVKWHSSNTDIVYVSSKGKLTAKKAGSVTITGTTQNGLSAECQVSVLSTYVATQIPERTTSIADIPANLKKIDAIKESAKNQIALLVMDGAISATESANRQQVIDRAFEMQAFPWMTETTQEYWTADYAYKRYVPGVVYYGLPYIQRGNRNAAEPYDNREYNVAKAVSERRYTDSGNGYYLLNRSRLLNYMYVGNDCSAFVGISEFGMNHKASFIRTGYLTTSPYYETIEFSKMRPGDILVLGQNHTVMFLYWVDSAKSKMMIIEQGGDGNTVICSIHNLSYYSSQGYIARRRADFN